MDEWQEIFSALWQDYTTRLCPSASKIHQLLQHGGPILNDHIALRTFNIPNIGREKLAAPFLALGYEEKGAYFFKQKKLSARHYEHPDLDAPKVFISELLVEQCSPALQQLIKRLAEQADNHDMDSPDFLWQGRLWPLSKSEYQQASLESEYAGWVAAHGYGANHFTVNVNRLVSYHDINDVNSALKKAGFLLNNVSGEIKGSPNVYLEQSSTLADKVSVVFEDGIDRISGGFYEFAKRYSLPDGNLYQGFVEASADKIFESTNN